MLPKLAYLSPSQMNTSVLDRLRVYKQVCHKIRTSLVAGREEIVSPRTVSRSFLEFCDKLEPASSTDSGIFPGDGALGDSPARQTECPFIEAADGWNVEYSERQCEVLPCRVNYHCGLVVLGLGASLVFVNSSSFCRGWVGWSCLPLSSFTPLAGHVQPFTHSFPTSQRCRGGGLCTCHQPPSLELRPLAEAAYRQHFYQYDHWNYFTEEPDIGPCLLSLKQEADLDTFR